jgi:hypothetical protein
VIRSPKCHPELAGEGVEYSWGCSKGEHRRRPIQDKRTKEKFKKSVRHCLSREVLTMMRIRKFSRRACQYILAYNCMEQHNNQQQLSAYLIEKVVKTCRSHRSAADFDLKFINNVVASMKSVE